MTDAESIQTMAKEIVVKNATLFREASYQGASHYAELFQKRNDFFMNARKKEWDAL